MCEWMKSACSESAVGSPSMSSVVSERYFIIYISIPGGRVLLYILSSMDVYACIRTCIQ